MAIKACGDEEGATVKVLLPELSSNQHIYRSSAKNSRNGLTNPRTERIPADSECIK